MPGVSKADSDFLALAFAEAKKGLGRTSPNPSVGAVVVKAGRVIAGAHHVKAGGPHAEVLALEQAGKRAKGSTLYLTLEPCNHHGRTPPCTEAILAAGVSRVVAAIRDPNPAVTGGGLNRLRRAGVQVEVGFGYSKTFPAHFYRAWFHYLATGQPYVTLKVAMTLDGCLATESGDSRWISSESSREEVHQLRNRVDAVLVGAGTVRADDPRLTARFKGARSPLRVVLDGRLSTSRRAKVYRPGHLLFSTVKPKPGDLRRVEVLTGKNGRLPLGKVLERLAKLGVVHLLVEGGAEVFTQFLEAELWDELRIFLAPRLAGPAGIRWFQGRSAARMRDALNLGDFSVCRSGPDVSVTIKRGRQRAL